MPGIATRPLNLPLVRHPATRQLLYPHQAAVLDSWERCNSFLVMTKTGTGKTISAILPVLKHRQRAICVYPTNELIRDQVRNIAGIAEREGLKVCIQTPETTSEEYASADVILVHVDAPVLEAWCKKRHWREKWRALRDLLEADKPKIVLTNPDILFLVFALRYHAEPLAALPGYHALIVDEFHLYSGVELVHALFMLHLGRSLGAFDKIVLLSATPAPEVSDYLDRVLDDPLHVDIGASCPYSVLDERQAVQRVEVVPCLAGQDVVDTAVRLVREIEAEIRQRRLNNPSPTYVPAVVVVNSVVNAIRLEDCLVQAGFQREEMAIIRGLSARDVRDTKGKLLAIGTSAIEVGIDFQCDYLIFEAGEAASFMQRFGRVGRHSPGVAYVLCPHNVLLGIEALRREKGPEVDRSDLEEQVYAWYPSLDTRAWFATTFMGLVSAFTLAESLVKRVRDDFGANPKHVANVEMQMEQFYLTYAQKLNCDDRTLQRVLAYLRKGRQQDPKYKWLTVYRDLNTFRTSLPSEWVLDFAELKRRGGDCDKAKYTADVTTLLRRAEGLRFNERIPHPDGKMGTLTVKGYERYKKIWVMPTFTDDQCGILYCTGDFPDLHFIQEGHKTSVSHVMTLRDHVFVVVPKAVQLDLDWRLPVFECGRHLIAFDGAALMLYEMYYRKQTRSAQEG